MRILGTGSGMKALLDEIDAVRGNGFRLAFRVPTEGELKRIKRIQRDIPEAERIKIRQVDKSVTGMLELIYSGALDVESLPPDLLAKLSRFGSRSNEHDTE